MVQPSSIVLQTESENQAGYGRDEEGRHRVAARTGGKNGGIPETLKRRQRLGGESHVGVERTPPLSLAEKKNWVEAGRECLREKSELDSRHAEFPVPTRVSKQVVSKATTHQQRRERELGS